VYQGHFPTLGHEAELRCPPFGLVDDAGREITIRKYGSAPAGDDYEALVAMYRDFDPAYRSLGIPPIGEDRIRRWLDVVLGDVCVLACHDGRPIGQAVLVEDGPRSAELAIFLHQDYHGAGIGTALLTATLAVGKRRGLEHVWLLVERDNRLAVNLYNDLGFAVLDDEGPDLEMGLAL
jgi:GNAT superfamily N-acetyltransferase